MADIAPFRGVRYAVECVGRLDDVVAPPYDVITPEQRTALVARSRLNIVELDLPAGRDDRKYAHAGDLWRQWRAEKVLRADAVPALYLVEERFTTPLGRPCLRKGFVAALTLDEPGKGTVRPHEKTFAGPKEDRLKLMRATRANLSQVFALYRDREHRLERAWAEVTQATPDVRVSAPDGTRRMWMVTEPDLIERARTVLSSSPLVIADGHHRYETAITYRNECRERGGPAGADSTMVYLSSMDDLDLTVLPTHRMVRLGSALDMAGIRRRLEQHFELEPVLSERPEHWLADALSEGSGEPYQFGLFSREWGWLFATLRSWEDVAGWIDPTRSDAWRRLDVAVLHEVVLRTIVEVPDTIDGRNPVAYTPDPGTGHAAVRRGAADLFLMLRPATAAQIAAVAEAGDRMPQKSTYFFPKLLTGLVMRSLEA